MLRGTLSTGGRIDDNATQTGHYVFGTFPTRQLPLCARGGAWKTLVRSECTESAPEPRIAVTDDLAIYKVMSGHLRLTGCVGVGRKTERCDEHRPRYSPDDA
jgi:hypothetical protein